MNNRDVEVISGGGETQSIFGHIVSLPNLLTAWREFRRGKSKKEDVLNFEFHLEDNLFNLNKELINKTYRPEKYESFFVQDPKKRHIHKATVRDRVLHQAIFRILYPIFDKNFIHHSYSSRTGKGTHKGVKSLFIGIRKISSNWKKPAYTLKCDIKKFFDSIDHNILLKLIERKINCKETFNLIESIVKSFEKNTGKGLPLGNVTSQLFANIYLNELDQFVKHELKVRYYFRYADDFVVLGKNIDELEKTKIKIALFLKDSLDLELHKDKVFIKKVSQGIDFLGYVVLPNAIVLRTKTKRRILKRVNKNNKSSYLGVLLHCRGKILDSKIKKLAYARQDLA